MRTAGFQGNIPRFIPGKPSGIIARHANQTVIYFMLLKNFNILCGKNVCTKKDCMKPSRHRIFVGKIP
jgi:hypothetical protein